MTIRVFREFVAREFTKAGVKKWLSEQTPEEQVKRSASRDVFVAIVNHKIVGMIEGVNSGNIRISRLFVDKHYQGTGIGKALAGKIFKLNQMRGVRELKVYSSMYALKFYEHLGFKKTTGLRKKHGMIYQPVKKSLKP